MSVSMVVSNHPDLAEQVRPFGDVPLLSRPNLLNLLNWGFRQRRQRTMRTMRTFFPNPSLREELHEQGFGFLVLYGPL